LLLLSALMLVWTAIVTHGQEISAPSQPPASPAATVPIAAPPQTNAAPPTTALLSAPIPFNEVPTQAKADSTTLRNIEAGLLSDHITDGITNDLPILTREINPRLDENSKILIANPSLGILSRLANGWQQTIEELSAWERQCTARVKLLDSQRTRLAEIESIWEQTRNLAAKSAADSHARANPPLDTIRQDIERAATAVRLTHEAVDRRREQVLALQSRIVEEKARIAEMIVAIKHARSEVLGGLFIQNGSPIWTEAARAGARQNLVAETRSSLSSQWAALRAYAERQVPSICLHLLFVALLGGALSHLRRRVQALVEEEPPLRRASIVFDTPVATAVLLSILLSTWIYPQAPRLLLVILGAAALIPAILILRRLIERPLYPILNALVAFYFMSQLRDLLAASQALSRGLFLIEFLGGILFLAWLIRSERLSAVPDAQRSRLWGLIWTGARIALVGSIVVFVANLVGYVDLANYLGSAILASLNLAAILYTLLRVLDGLFAFTLYVWPLNLLDMVRQHHQAFRRLAHSALEGAAVILWALYTLEQLGLRDPLIAKTTAVLNATLSIASFRFSLGHLLAFVITVWAAFLLSRFLRFLLDEDVYPRVHLAPGIPYAMSTLLNYVILLIGFYIAIAALGFDMNRFTILAGAFGVGFGFGLQNIINNFVSGLILLFERPVKVGDVVQMEGAGEFSQPGVVERIGIRASIIRVTNGAEVIVPNAKLISDRVTNWTYSNRRRSIEIPISVASTADPQRVMELLQQVAAANPLLVSDPPPEALFVKFGAGTLDFELHAWTDHYEEWQRIRSDLATAIHNTLTKENILIP
jgi:potassium-dependent mechanosensitive channel